MEEEYKITYCKQCNNKGKKNHCHECAENKDGSIKKINTPYIDYDSILNSFINSDIKHGEVVINMPIQKDSIRVRLKSRINIRNLKIKCYLIKKKIYLEKI